MEQYKIGEVEMRFAEIVWRVEPVSLGELAEAVKAELGWKKSETEIMVKQLCEKGVFTLEKDLIKAKISRSAFQRIEQKKVSAYTEGENVRGKSSAGFGHSFWAPVAFEEGDVKSRIKNIMKYRKTITVLAVCAVVVCILAGGLFLAKAEQPVKERTKVVESDIYSTKDIDAAVETIIAEFSSKEWKGCKLTEIYYAGDEESSGYQEWLDRNDADELIVLLSSFDVGPFPGDGLNPNSTYRDFCWILVRDIGGQWKCVDGGY